MTYLHGCLILALACKSLQAPVTPFPVYQVEVIDLNHVVKWDEEKGFEEDLTQLIFWSFQPAEFGPSWRVQDWILLTADPKTGKIDMPAMHVTKDGKVRMQFEFQGEQQVVIADKLRETFTQYDPERAEAKIFGERKGLWR